MLPDIVELPAASARSLLAGFDAVHVVEMSTKGTVLGSRMDRADIDAALADPAARWAFYPAWLDEMGRPMQPDPTGGEPRRGDSRLLRSGHRLRLTREARQQPGAPTKRDVWMAVGDLTASDLP